LRFEFERRWFTTELGKKSAQKHISRDERLMISRAYNPQPLQHAATMKRISNAQVLHQLLQVRVVNHTAQQLAIKPETDEQCTVADVIGRYRSYLIPQRFS
jgi:hypothetical protein